jgi:hypothetical protein
VQRKRHNVPKQRALEHKYIGLAMILGFKSSNKCSQNTQE